MATDQGTAYCIFDNVRKSSAWVGLNEAGYDFVVTSGDPGSDSICVEYRGQSLSLVLRPSKVASSGEVRPAAPGAAAGAVNLALAITPAAVPSPEETERARAIYAEVHRRIVERKQMAQNISAPGRSPEPSLK
jgi:hypothetical protein